MCGRNKPGYHRPRRPSNYCPYRFRHAGPYSGSRKDGCPSKTTSSTSHPFEYYKKAAISRYAPQQCDPSIPSTEFAFFPAVKRTPPSSTAWPMGFSASNIISDEEAAQCVKRHLECAQFNPARIHAERELIRLILSSPFEERHLSEVLQHANIVFFEGLLESSLLPLRWWASSHGTGDIIGTTELRPTRNGGIQTRITLSKSILQRSDFDQRLVLSAVLHEAIHAYLFVRRGFAATKEGGHSEGFRTIARLIDDWIGDESYLQLQRTEAILENFETKSKNGWRRDTLTWGTAEHGFKCVGSKRVDRWEHRR